MRVIEAGNRSCFALDRFAGHAKPLDGDGPVEPGVPGLPDLSHAAGANTAQEDVRADLASHFPDAHDIKIVV